MSYYLDCYRHKDKTPSASYGPGTISELAALATRVMHNGFDDLRIVDETETKGKSHLPKDKWPQ